MADEYNFHLRVFHNGTEKAKEEYRQWYTGFAEIEKKAKGLNLNYSFVDNFDIGNTTLSVYITGRDLFLGIWDAKEHKLYQEIDFECIEYTSVDILSKLQKGIKRAFKGLKDEDKMKKQEIYKVWPHQVVNIRKYEKEMGINQKPDIPTKQLEIPKTKLR